MQPAPLILNVSGKPITVFGKTEVKLKVLGNLPMIEVEEIVHECILGDNELSSYRAILDYDNQMVQWKGKSPYLHPYGKPYLLDTASSSAGDVRVSQYSGCYKMG